MVSAVMRLLPPIARICPINKLICIDHRRSESTKTPKLYADQLNMPERRREIRDHRDLLSYEPRFTSAALRGLYGEEYRRATYVGSRRSDPISTMPGGSLANRVGNWTAGASGSNGGSSSQPRATSLLADHRSTSHLLRQPQPGRRSESHSEHRSGSGRSTLTPTYMHGYRVRESHTWAPERPSDLDHPAFRTNSSSQPSLPLTTRSRPATSHSSHPTNRDSNRESVGHGSSSGAIVGQDSRNQCLSPLQGLEHRHGSRSHDEYSFGRHR